MLLTGGFGVVSALVTVTFSDPIDLVMVALVSALASAVGALGGMLLLSRDRQTQGALMVVATPAIGLAFARISASTAVAVFFTAALVTALVWPAFIPGARFLRLKRLVLTLHNWQRAEWDQMILCPTCLVPLYTRMGCKRCGTEVADAHRYRAPMAVRLVSVAVVAVPFCGWVLIHLYELKEPVAPVFVAAVLPSAAVACMGAAAVTRSEEWNRN